MNAKAQLLTAALLGAATCFPAGQGAIAQQTTQPAPVPGPAAIDRTQEPMDTAERTAVVTEMARLIEGRYVFPDVGARYAATLRKALASGRYDELTDQDAFAKQVTADLQAVAPDRHLRVFPVGTGRPMMTRMGGDGPAALEEARLLADGIAYLRFNLFPNDPKTAEAARAFLLANADVHTVIIDCRPNRGGTLMVMDAILPLFYASPTTLVRTDTREDVARELGISAGPTRVARPAAPGIVRNDHVVEPDEAETRLRDARLFYLTSKGTASAAEHLALALKRTSRATLIGETTGGAGRFGFPANVGRFTIFVPFGHTYDPDTGQGWEATGIAPDIGVPADQALQKALELAGLSTEDATRIAAAPAR